MNINICIYVHEWKMYTHTYIHMSMYMTILCILYTHAFTDVQYHTVSRNTQDQKSRYLIERMHCTGHLLLKEVAQGLHNVENISLRLGVGRLRRFHIQWLLRQTEARIDCTRLLLIDVDWMCFNFNSDMPEMPVTFKRGDCGYTVYRTTTSQNN